MFTWICPQCGREVPPHETECPDCVEKAKRAASGEAAPEGAQPPPEQAAGTPVPPQSPRQPSDQVRQAAASGVAQPQPQPTYEVGGRHGMPGWAVTLLVAVGVLALGAAAYYYVLPSVTGRSAAERSSPFEEVPAAGSMSASTNRLTRFIEATGFRITEDAQKRTQIQFLVVNHSAADIGDLAGKIHLRSTKANPEDAPICSFDFNTSRLGPYESVEFKVVTTTNLRAYELPDWQYVTAEVEITSPSAL